MRSLALVVALFLAGPLFAEPDTHWSFRPCVRPAVPVVRSDCVRTPVDAFILARLKKEGLKPAAEADRVTLIRRVAFDLTGLPPTPAEIDAFIRDQSPNAYERLVDRLLASPAYGEKWGRYWLDVVRYAETEGFEYDRLRAGAWRFRDYAIAAFNADKPFDRFVVEQLAGDEIDPASDELQVAAGFNRVGPVRRNAGNQELAFSRNEVLTEMADATGAAFLGLTVACARCHDHKFDPISQEDYYAFQAFWAAAQERDVARSSPIIRAIWKAQTDAVQTEIKKLQKTMARLTGEDRSKAEAKVKELEASLSSQLPTISTVHDVASERTTVHVLRRGNTDLKGKAVGPKLPEVGFPRPAPELSADTPNPRTILARAITSRDNPLTARVLVNRVWQGHFGHGIVDTPNDFGANGSRPTHPELLDWLASEFMENGWSIKHLHRVIVNSATYRQSSNADVGTRNAERKSDPRSVDPDDRLLWRFPRHRLTAEEVRDSMLAVAGRLNRKAGGPSVVVPVDDDLLNQLYTPSQWVVTRDPAEHDRRSVYLLAKRNLRLPFLGAFDQPDAATSCPRRESSTHALQALEMLNGSFANDLAKAFADRLRREAGTDPSAQVELAYRLSASRPPTSRERELGIEFLRTQPLSEFALAVFNLNAFLYVD
jgi:hypothetical protein